MKIVFYSPNFYPMIGGLENVVMDLATELSRLGHSVRVLTLTPSEEPDLFPFDVVRGARFWQTVLHIRWGEVYVQFNISLKGILPWLVTLRPLVATHHNLYYELTIRGWLKRFVARWLSTINTGCSNFIATHYHRGQWLPNPYNDAVFQQRPGVEHENSLVFLGRLVSSKGCDVLLHALGIVNERYNLTPPLTIIGSGPERVALEQLGTKLGITSQVTFVGNQTGSTLADILNRHIIMVVPSVYEEPFGIVALEGIACGLFLIGSKAGGLPEAIGHCGVTFPMSDAPALAKLIAEAITQPNLRSTYQANAATHLAAHTRNAVAKRFLELLDKQL